MSATEFCIYAMFVMVLLLFLDAIQAITLG